MLEVKAEDAYALVQPGVAFFDLHEYMEKRNLREKVWIDAGILNPSRRCLHGLTLLIGTRLGRWIYHWQCC